MYNSWMESWPAIPQGFHQVIHVSRHYVQINLEPKFENGDQTN